MENVNLKEFCSFSKGKDLFVLFGLSNCRACKRAEDAFMEVKSKYSFELKALRIDKSLETSERLLQEFFIEVFPTSILFKNGEEYKRWGGFFSDDIHTQRVKKLTTLLNEMDLK